LNGYELGALATGDTCVSVWALRVTRV